jgi:hypothetical protein
MARGGRRNGKTGTAYPQRTDLNGAPRVATPALPNVAPSNQYGEATKLKQAQQVVPMGPPPSAPSSPGGSGGGVAESPQSIQAGGLGAFDRPTERPNEPVTAGIASGPGAGPPAAATVPTTVSDLLGMLAAERGVSPEVAHLNDWLKGGRA